MKLWLLRHAQVQVEPGVCYGVSDVPASESDTLKAAEAFAVHPAQGCLVWSSPLSRAWVLGKALCQRREDMTQLHADARLCEMNFGVWEMQTWESIPKAAMDAWVTDFAYHRFGGGESTQQVIDRVRRVLDDARALNVPEMVWVTHAGVIRAIQYVIDTSVECTIINANQWPVHAPSYGEWIALEV
jgi:alpha-ribazole phosphatase